MPQVRIEKSNPRRDKKIGILPWGPEYSIYSSWVSAANHITPPIRDINLDSVINEALSHLGQDPVFHGDLKVDLKSTFSPAEKKRIEFMFDMYGGYKNIKVTYNGL